jgi:molybdopterin/thiamine biosynthesis adenylyltransferase
MVATVNAEVTYGYLDPVCPGEDLALAVPRQENGWLVVFVNDPAGASRSLESVISAHVDMPVLLALDAPGGVMVVSCSGPQAAAELVGSLVAGGPTAPIPCGPPELGILLSGIVTNEVMTEGDGITLGVDTPHEAALTACYSTRQPRRVLSVETDELQRRFGELVAEIAGPAGPLASFNGRSISMVGAGALGNWCALPLAMESPSRLTIHDGDQAVEVTNLNRQVLLARSVGMPKAEALVSELRALDPAGTYEAVGQDVKGPEDLGNLQDTELVLSVPDNDEARLICADAAHAAGVLCGTAGSSALGAQAVTVQPGRSCYRCVSGIDGSSGAKEGRASCGLVENDAVVGSNQVAAGLLLHEVRLALSGRRSSNVRFFGTGPAENRLGRMITDPPCPHRISITEKAS